MRLLGNLSDYPKTSQTAQTLFRLTGNFPDRPETSQCNFKGYTQKLFGWQCHDATMVFVPLLLPLYLK